MIECCATCQSASVEKKNELHPSTPLFLNIIRKLQQPVRTAKDHRCKVNEEFPSRFHNLRISSSAVAFRGH